VQLHTGTEYTGAVAAISLLSLFPLMVTVTTISSMAGNVPFGMAFSETMPTQGK
jgi:uncharacterized BrkB/YihY/UPF0761 family membrane protein